MGGIWWWVSETSVGSRERVWALVNAFRCSEMAGRSWECLKTRGRGWECVVWLGMGVGGWKWLWGVKNEFRELWMIEGGSERVNGLRFVYERVENRCSLLNLSWFRMKSVDAAGRRRWSRICWQSRSMRLGVVRCRIRSHHQNGRVRTRETAKRWYRQW